MSVERHIPQRVLSIVVCQLDLPSRIEHGVRITALFENVSCLASEPG